MSRPVWEVWELDDSIQVKPNYGPDHVPDASCWCCPLVETSHNGVAYSMPLLVHNSEQ